jgi:hypothetical protein
MTMAPPLRRCALTAHVVSSVGWLGAVAGFLALALAGLTTDDGERARAAYLAMEFIAWSVIVPLSVASLLTGLVQALGTTWGLFQHYWVVTKLVLNLVATIVLLLYMESLGTLADVAAHSALTRGDLQGARVQAVVHAGAALVLLLLAATLSVYKPRGRTPYGLRKQRELRAASHP